MKVSLGETLVTMHIYACQIICSKSNCETMHHWFFLLEITVTKIMNNLNVCSSHSYLYPRYRFNYATCYWNACARPGKWVVIYMCVRDIHLTSISTIVGLDFRTVLTVWNCFVFHFIEARLSNTNPTKGWEVN